MDLNPLTTPNNVLTDALNATIITYNGDEFVLQNDMGNCKVDKARLTPGFIPMGMKEYGGIIYIASYNPITRQCEFGSFPSPQEDFSTTDYEELGPVEFKDTQFILETNTTHESVTQLVGKLSEPELFELHPGDKYIIVYDIIDPAPPANPSDPDKVDSEAKYEDWISKDPTSRKLFKLVFYKITDSNNLVALDPTKVKVIPNAPDVDDEYVYFTGNSNATIAVGLQIEQLDYFDANIVDRSLRTDVNKKVGIEAIGVGNSLATFEGIKVEVTSPSSMTFYLDKTGVTKKVSGILDGLAQGDQFQCSVTPYSPYCLYPALRKDYKLTMGTYLSTSSNVNDIFRYYMDPAGFMKVDFDYKFEGNSPEGIHLYIEFYDPWSDYSIIKTVDNPTYYGLNDVVLELVDEPAVDVFNSTTRGGTNPNKLITNPDTIYERSQLNSSNLIRVDQALRKDHFYIVRISGVDRIYDPTTSTFTYQHYDLYKGMYTNNMYNGIYSIQNGLASTDPAYVADFNALDFDISTVRYNSAIEATSSVSLTPVLSSQRDDLTTDGKYYKISPSTLSTSPGYKSTKTYESRKGYNINLTLDGIDNIFGTFKENLLSVTAPTLQDSDGTDPDAQKPTVVDAGYDNNTNIAPDSLADWVITNVGAKQYTLSTNLKTSRSVYAPVAQTTRNDARIYAEVPLLPSLWHKPNGDGLYSPDRRAGMFIAKYDLRVQRANGTQYTYPLGSGASPQDNNVLPTIEAIGGRTWSAVVMTSNDPTWGYGGGTDYNSCNDGGAAAWKHCNMLLKSDSDGYYYLTKTIDYDAIVQFFSNLFVASNVTSAVNVYYPSTSTSINGQIESTATYPDLEFVTTFTPDTVSSSYVPTYLSTFRFHALGTIEDFKAEVLNDYIADNLGDSVIMDNKQTLRDGFIPYISTPVESTGLVEVPSISINQAGDNSVLTKFLSGETQYPNDAIFRDGLRTHGTLFTKITAFQPYVDMLVPKGFSSGVEINPNTVYVGAKSQPLWRGHFAYANRCKDDNDSPSLMPTFDIRKQ